MIFTCKNVLEGEVLPPPSQLNSLLILIVDVLWGYPLPDNEQLKVLEVAFHDWPIEGLCMLQIEPVRPFHGDLANILLEEPGIQLSLSVHCVKSKTKARSLACIIRSPMSPHHLHHSITTIFCMRLRSCWDS